MNNPAHQIQQALLFNGVDGETGCYPREPMEQNTFLHHIYHSGRNYGSDPLPGERALAAWADARNLAEAGWGVLLHEDEDPDVLDQIKPLLEHRQRQAGKRFHVLLLRKSDIPKLGSGKSILDNFLSRHGAALSDVDPDRLPYYVLILGSPLRIPFAFQYELDIAHAVGRLDFEDVKAYGTYARNLVATETSPPLRDKRLALFGAQNDELTEWGVRYVVNPLAERLARHRQNKKIHQSWQIETITAEAATKERLNDLMQGASAPVLLFTSGHGLCFSFKKPAFLRRKDQGALVCSGWRPGEKPVRDQFFSAADVSPKADLRGRILFHFACFTAGTPALDNFDAAENRYRWHLYPFTAKLPESLLAHERGPLAVIGHVDQAFQYSFLWDERIHEINHFTSAFYKLMKGFPVGAAMEPFDRRFAQISARTLEVIMREGPSEQTLLQSWVAYHDSRNYVILGDPAVSLGPTVGKEKNQ